jgi:tetratricopeptide (TPR) repeat protein
MTRHNIPWPRNPAFVGREKELAVLADTLAAGRIPAIAGAGGLGKTQLAVELAYRLAAQDRYPGGIWWLTMDPADGVGTRVAELAASRWMNLPGYDETKAEQNRELVLAAWEQPTPRLLIFDNLEDPAVWRDWQPRRGGCRVLITTRRTTWAERSGVWPLPLEPLERDASLALLLAEREAAGGAAMGAVLADPAERAAANTICEAVGDLPLALALAGAYLGTTPHTPLARYRAALEQSVLAHPSMHAEWLDEALPTQHIPSIVATFNLSYDRLNEDHPAAPTARRLFHRAGHLAPAPIARPLLVRLAADDPSAEPPPEAGLAADAALHRLAAVGLIELLPDGLARLHRLLAAYARARTADPADDQAVVEVALLAEMDAIGRLAHPSAWQPYIDHLRHATESAKSRTDEDAATLLNNLGYLLQEQGDYETARPLYERALAIREQELDPAHPATAQSLNNLAALLYAQGDYGAARPLYERAMAIYVQALGPTHPTTAYSLNNLAELLRAQGDYEAARPLYERALAIREQALGPFHPDTAGSLNNLAELLCDQGDYGAARPLYERALAIDEQALGPVHPATATSLNNLAWLLKAQGDYEAARPLYERALAIREQALGPDHPATATSLSNLAVLLYAQEDYEGARPLYERALAIREQALGFTHPDTAQSLDNLAESLQAQGDYKAARSLYERALAIREQALGSTHRATAQSLNNLARLLKAQGDYAAARPLLERALTIHVQALGPTHPDTAGSLNNLALLLAVQGDYAVARPLLERALRILEQALGPQHPYTVTARENLVRCLAEGFMAALVRLSKNRTLE